MSDSTETATEALVDALQAQLAQAVAGAERARAEASLQHAFAQDLQRQLAEALEELRIAKAVLKEQCEDADRDRAKAAKDASQARATIDALMGLRDSLSGELGPLRSIQTSQRRWRAEARRLRDVCAWVLARRLGRETALRSAATEAARALGKVDHALHREFGWLNYPPRGLCICHLIKGGPEYDDVDTYVPPADQEHEPECDGYNSIVKSNDAALSSLAAVGVVP